MDPNINPNPSPESLSYIEKKSPFMSRLDSFFSKFSRFRPYFQNPKIVIIACVTFLLLSAFIVSLLSAYTPLKIPFISQELRKNLVLFYYKMPLFPKTSEQILTAAVDYNARLGTFSPKFSLSAILTNTNVTVASLDLKAEGPVSFPENKKIAFDLQTEANINFAGNNYDISAQIKNLDEVYYIKLNKIPDYLLNILAYSDINSANNPEVKSNLSKAMSNWIKYDTKGMQTEARKNIEATGQQSLVEQARKDTQEFLLKSNVLPEIKRLGDETLQGVPVYHLRISPSKKLIEEIYREYALGDEDLKTDPDSINRQATVYANAIKTLTLDVWFGKKDTILRKASFVNTTDLKDVFNTLNAPALQGARSGNANTNVLGATQSVLPGVDLLRTKLSISSVLEIQDIGSETVVTAPDKTVSYDEYFRLLENAQKTKAQLALEAKKDQYDKELGEFYAALSLYYADNGRYPGALIALQGGYIPATSNLQKSFNQYLYKVSPDGRRFLVYVMYVSDDSASLPYYGVSSEYLYPSQLDAKDFQRLTDPPSPSTY